VLYTTVDRADNQQFRALCAPKAAIAAVKAGQPYPSGTVIAMLKFKAKRNAGEPETGRQRPLHTGTS